LRRVTTTVQSAASAAVGIADTPTRAAISAKASSAALRRVRFIAVVRSPRCMETASACADLLGADDRQASY
jgi:hypothetical protein